MGAAAGGSAMVASAPRSPATVPPAAGTRLRGMARSASPRSARAVVVHGSISFALVWQGLWMVAEPSARLGNQSHALVVVALAISMATWAGLLVAHLLGWQTGRLVLSTVDVAALFAATITLLWQAGLLQPPDWGSASSFAILPAGLAGMLFAWRTATCWVAAVVLVELGAILGLTPLTNAAADLPGDLLYPGYALTIGVLSISARQALVSDADRADRAAEGAAEAEAERLAAEGVEHAIRQEERVLHETVLNTLTAIARGGLTARPALRARLTERCWESAQTLHDLRERTELRLRTGSSERLLERDIAPSLVDLSTSGVLVDVDCHALTGVPDVVYGAITTAVREAVSNILRHAQAGRVRITAAVVREGRRSRVEVSVSDDGHGFDLSAPSHGLGVATAVRQGMAEVGGTARVDSTPGAGTRIDLSWAFPSVAPVGTFRPSAARFAVPVLIAYSVYTAAIVAVGWAAFDRPEVSLLAFVLYVGLSVLVMVAARRGPLRWGPTIAVAVLGPLVYELQIRALDPGADAPWTEWASGAIAVLFLVVAAIGPRWAWVVVVAAWLVMQGDIVGELIAPGTAVIVAGALFGRSTRRNSISVARLREQETAQLAALAVARDGVHGLQRRYGALRESRAIALLERIATGDLDPDDPQVRAEAALEERFIRTVIRVDPSRDAVHALATSLAVRARRRGVFLDIELTVPEDGPADLDAGADDVAASLSRAVDGCVPGREARLTAGPEGGALVVRLLAPISPDDRDEMMCLPVPGIDLGPGEGEDLAMLWEVSLEPGSRS